MKRKALVALAGLLLVVASGLVFQGDTNAAALTASVKVGIGGTYSNTVDLLTSESKINMSGRGVDFANGTGASQANILFTDTRTIAASTTEDLDIRGTSLVDSFGNDLACVELKALMVFASSANTNNVVLGGDANSVPFLSTAATTVSIKPGGAFVLLDPSAGGVAVTADTGDILQVANSGGTTTVTYDIVAFCSAS